jgi:hypothetical protein
MRLAAGGAAPRTDEQPAGAPQPACPAENGVSHGTRSARTTS